METGEMLRNVGPLSLDKGKVTEIRVGTDRIEIFVTEPFDTVAHTGPGNFKYTVLGNSSLVKLAD